MVAFPVLNQVCVYCPLHCRTGGLTPEGVFALVVGRVLLVERVLEVTTTGAPVVVSKPLQSRTTRLSSLLSLFATSTRSPAFQNSLDGVCLGVHSSVEEIVHLLVSADGVFPRFVRFPLNGLFRTR
ncbi:hypothetical protein C475_18631 [Halosimplex carlsbadense 2-9-1]|uniref:Uncharacterized protein n=1 Tax=Halosimplex carlsbadense 2-9-1 TaxID=797114 RepID=M0CI68_9EURY|nr:hypothetical protein C475_18631 [Halosimplex carlsbadense 2-9-1]